MEQVNILIVGGTGFIGSNLTKKALEQGYRITVLSLTKQPIHNKLAKVNYIEADITDLENLKALFLKKKYQYIINLSGYIDHADFSHGGDKVVEAHFYGLYCLVKSIRRDSLKRFIHIGSSDEYGNNKAPQNENQREQPISPYSFSKVASTHFLQMLYKTEGFPAVIVRLFLVYGPGQDNNRLIPQIINGCLKGVDFPTSQGDQYRDFCYVDDISNGLVNLIKAKGVDGEVINLASGVPIKIKHVVGKIKSHIGIGNPVYGGIQYRKYENMHLYADISKAKNFIKWNPETTLSNGIVRTINYYLSFAPHR